MFLGHRRQVFDMTPLTSDRHIHRDACKRCRAWLTEPYDAGPVVAVE